MAPKDKKLFGILGLFRKKTSSEVKKESVMSNSIESFSEINELILSPQLTYKPNITGASKSSKSFAAPAPPSSTQNINKEVKENCDATPVEMLGEKSVGNCPDKPATIKDEDYWNDRQDKGNAVQSVKTMQKNLQSIVILKKEHQSELSLQENRCESSSSMASSIFLETEVIHYSPPGTIRRATHSPDHVTDFPNIERRSNVILKDPNRLKSIPVTRYDGRSKQETIIQPLKEKKQTISPSSVTEKSTSIDVASVFIDQCSYSAPLSSKTTPYSPNKGIIRKIEASSSKSLQRTNMQQNPGFISNSSQSVSTRKDLEVTKYEIEDAQRATEITNRYKALKAKFDIWQTLQTTGKNLPETKELHVELIRDHDSLMRQLQLANTKESSPTRVGIGKKRQSITPDLFTPKSLLGIRTISNSSPALPHRPSLSLKDIRYPTSTGSSSSHTSSPSSSRPGTPKLTHSSSSLSPTTSSMSDDGNKPINYRHLESREKLSATIQKKVDENSNEVIGTTMKKGISVTKVSEKVDDEKKRATNRILEEARELKRKEDELRRKPTIESNRNEQEVLRAVPKKSNYEADTTLQAKSQIKVQSHHSTINEISRFDLINFTNTSIKSKIKEKGNNKIRRPENMPSLKKVENYENRNNQSPEATTVLIPQMPHYETCHHKLVASYNGNISPARTNQEAVISKYNYQKLPINQSKDELVKDMFSKPAISQNKASPQEIMPKLDKSIVLKQERTLIDDAPTVSNHYKMTPSKENNNIAEEKGATKPPSSITKAKKCKKLTEVECTKIHLNTEYSTRNKTNIEQITPPNTKKAVKEKEGIINNIIGEGFSTLKKVPTPVEKSGIQLGKVIDSPMNIKISILPTISSPSSHSSIPIPQPPPPPPPMELLSNLSRSSVYVVSTTTTPTLAPKISVSLEQLNEQKLKLKPASMNDKPVRVSQDIRDCLLEEIRNSGGIKSLKKVHSPTKI